MYRYGHPDADKKKFIFDAQTRKMIKIIKVVSRKTKQ